MTEDPLRPNRGDSLLDLADRPGPLVIAGNLSLDDTINAEGSFPDSPGGDALYAAIGARLWGVDVEILILPGEDYPQRYLDQMRAIGIGTKFVRPVPGPTVHYRVTDDVTGARTYLHLTDAARLDETSPQGRDYHLIAEWGWLHLAAMPIDAHVVAVRAARAAGTPVSLDPHEEFVIGYEGTLRELIRGTGFMPSELEAGLLFPDLAAIGSGLTLGAAAAERLARWGTSFSAIKLGALGSVVEGGERSSNVRAMNVEVVDLIGAGDAYCGGFIAGLRRSGSLLVAAACGNVSAAHAISQFGAFPAGPLPTLDSMVAEAATLLRGPGVPAGLVDAFRSVILRP